MGTITPYCLCSGGKDSAAMTHYVIEGGNYSSRYKPIVVYLDTGTGLREQHEYVEELCDEFGWQLWTLRTHEDYEALVREHGFPGPRQHGKMYNRLKRRQLERLASRCDDVHFFTGIRGEESSNRMKNMDRIEEEPQGRWTWRAPLYDWTSDEVWEYVDEHDIPENPEWRAGGRASDCFCGAYASREELIDLAADHPEKAEWIRNLESSIDRDDDRDVWGWAKSSPDEIDAARTDDEPLGLCSGCSLPTADDVDDEA